MNLAQFEYLIALVEAGSYSQAAKALYISPQAVSKSIADMERELSVKLVERSGRGIVVTPFAIEISRLAESALRSVSEIRSLAKQQNPPCNYEERLRIALFTTPYRGSPFVEGDFCRFENEHTGVRAQVSFHSNDTCVTALLEDVVDVSVVMGKPSQPGIASSMITSVRPVATMLTSIACTYEEGVTFSDIAKMSLAMPLDLRCGYATLSSILRERELRPNFVNVALSFEAQRAFILGGGVILCFKNTPLPSLIPEASQIPLSLSEDAALPIYLACKKEMPSTLIVPLIEHLRISAKGSWLDQTKHL